jgi:predicted permease
MRSLLKDIQYAARRLAKNPGFTAVAVLSLALGIGANTAIFSVTNALLLKPLSFKNSDRLVIIWQRSPGLNIAQDWLSPGQYLDIKLDNQVFEDVGATLGVSFNLTGQAVPEHIEGARVSASLFSVLGGAPVLGRIFSAEDEQKGKSQAAILSYGFWQRRFGSDPEVLGQNLVLNDKSFTIVGVMQPDFSLNREIMPTVDSIQKADVLLPLQLSDADRAERGHEDYNIFAILKRDVSTAQAQADLDSMADRMKQHYPDVYPADGGLTLSAVPLRDQVVGEVRRPLFVLFGAVAFVLLIACANVANLLLSSAASRQREIAIRSALGASRRRVMMQLLTESLLLAFAGGGLGVALAVLSINALHRLGPASIPRLSEITVDLRVMVFTLIVSVATGLIFGFAPALKASRVDLNESLKEGGRSEGTAFGPASQRTRRILVVAEVALSLVLLIGAGLLIRSYQRIQSASPGYDTSNVLSLRLALPPARYSTPDAVISFYKRLSDRVKELPGIETEATTYLLPLSANALGWGPIFVDGYVPKSAQDLIISNEGFVSPDYFRTLKIPLVEGRYFDERDKKGAQEVVIVDTNLAERFWPGEDPLGKRIQRRNGGPWRTVIGVVRYQKEFSLDNEPLIRVYYPINQIPVSLRYLIARVSTDPEKATAAVSEQIRAIDPELPIFDVKPMDARRDDALARRRFATLLLGVFAACALVLSMIGIYGVISYWVNQRTHEIGIRVALGATRQNILRMVVRQSLVLVGGGIGIGVVGAFFLTRVMSSLLFGITATDRLTFAAISVLLASVALLASYVPARRATRIEPVAALRYQ